MLVNDGLREDLSADVSRAHDSFVPLFAVPHPRHAAYGERISLHE